MASLYDGNAVRKLEPEIQEVQVPKQRPQDETRENLVKLTEKKEKVASKKAKNPLNAVSKLVCVAAYFMLATAVIYGYVQITEVSNEINVADNNLNQLINEQVQLEMQVATIMNSTEVESYAQNQLGMNPVNPNQVIYVNVETENKGEVVVKESVNLWEKALEFFGFR